MLNAFCRVAPSDRFNFLAILAAGVLLRASDLSSRTCTEVHERLFVSFFINESPLISADVVAEKCVKQIVGGSGNSVGGRVWKPMRLSLFGRAKTHTVVYV
jgi:hypothetical protein